MTRGPDSIQHLGGTAAALASANPVLLSLEECFETDTTRSKIGDGTTAWNSLPYNDAAIYAPIVEAVNTVATSGSAQTIPDPSVQSISKITLTANCTFTMPTATAGKSCTVELIQNGTGGWTATFTGVKWSAGVTAVVTTTAAAVDVFTFACFDGTNWLGFISGQDMK